MSIFKKKKIEQMKKITLDVPAVVKASVIKPTKCEVCKTVYQAKQRHINPVQDMVRLNGKYDLFTQCPICLNYNSVEFEDEEE